MMNPETDQRQPYQEAREPAATSYDTARYLLEVKNVPDELKRGFWLWVQPLAAVSNLRYEDVNRVLEGYLLDAELAIQEIRVKGGKEITYKTVRWINQTYFCLLLNLMRSIGEERERKLLATSYRFSYGRMDERFEEHKRGRFRR